MIKRTFLLLLLCLALYVPVCYATSTETMVPRTMLIQVLNDWENSNKKLLTLLKEQKADSETVSKELIILKKALTEQKAQVQLLRIELITAKNELSSAKELLTTANKELKNIAEDCKALQRKNKIVERQRNIWEIVAAIATGIAAAR